MKTVNRAARAFGLVLCLLTSTRVARAQAIEATGPAAAEQADESSATGGSAANEESVPLPQAMPPPPPEPGCYRYLPAHGWERMECDTDEYIKQHIPPPEVLLGVGDNAISGSSTTAPFKQSHVGVTGLGSLGPEFDTDSGAANTYSIQDNVFFTGNNGLPDAVQFTNQAEWVAWPGFYVNNVCVWQIDIPNQTYTSTCGSVSDTHAYDSVYGETLDNGNLITFVRCCGGYYVVEAADIYQLESSNRWSNVSGAVLGYGTPPGDPGSEAVFAGPKGVATTTVEATTCNEWAVLSSAKPPKCTKARQLSKSDAKVIVSPGNTNGQTVERNNLVPVTGNPSTHPPNISFPNDWTVRVEYAATLTGKCPTGKPPLCK